MLSEHRVFLLFIAVLSLSAVLVLGLTGLRYYLTPIAERPFRTDHDQLKASGDYSHGLGIVGTALVIVGVSTYSTRKRIRALWRTGRLSAWLQFHIVLCLLGPILVIFHTTFKAGGVAGISLWTMISVWLSGMIGRFLYVQIPRTREGEELSTEQIQLQLAELNQGLTQTEVGRELSQQIDSTFRNVTRPTSLSGTLGALLHLSSARRMLRKSSRILIERAHLPAEKGIAIQKTVDARIALLQKSFALGQVARLFHYWHLIHLPFSVIMFITLAAHVVVTILVGYTWIF